MVCSRITSSCLAFALAACTADREDGAREVGVLDGTSTGAGAEQGDDSTGSDSGSGESSEASGDGDTTGEGSDAETSGAADETGGEPLCGPSNGAGGVPGLQTVAGDGYPNTPGKVYVPASYSETEPMPVMIALHGAGDTAQNFTSLWDDLAESERFIVVVPESVSGGASWNLGNDPPIISALYDRVAADYNVDQCRLYMTGYSAGAHVTYVIGLLNADIFAGLGIQAGSMTFAEQYDVWPNDVPRPIAVSIHHGTADPVVPFSHATHARDELEGAGHPVSFDSHSGGHEVGTGDPAEMWSNLAQHRLDQ